MDPMEIDIVFDTSFNLNEEELDTVTNIENEYLEYKKRKRDEDDKTSVEDANLTDCSIEIVDHLNDSAQFVDKNEDIKPKKRQKLNDAIQSGGKFPGYKCKYCKNRYPSIAERNTHQKAHPRFKCEFCPKEFILRIMLNKHYCSGRIVALTAFATHRATTNKSEIQVPKRQVSPNIYKCDSCSIEFALRSNFKRHTCSTNKSTDICPSMSIPNKVHSNNVQSNGSKIVQVTSLTASKNDNKPVSTDVTNCNNVSQASVSLPKQNGHGKKRGPRKPQKNTVNKFPCRFCSEDFAAKRLRFDHEESHKKFSCEFCNVRFMHNYSCLKHKRKYHSDKVTAVTTNPPASVSSDVNTGNTSDVTRVQSSSISDDTATDKVTHNVRSDVNHHIPKVQNLASSNAGNARPPPNTCENQKYLPDESDKNGTKPCKFQCQQCDESFKNKYELRYHVNLHKKWVCIFCDQRFVTASNLHRHEKRLHADNKLRASSIPEEKEQKPEETHHLSNTEVKCRFCDKIFSKRFNCNRHEANVHHAKVLKFKCYSCEAAFESDENRTNHEEEAHKRAKTYPCTLCPSYFKSLNDLESHVQQEHTEETNDEKTDNVQKYTQSLETNIKPQSSIADTAPIPQSEAVSALVRQRHQLLRDRVRVGSLRREHFYELNGPLTSGQIRTHLHDIYSKTTYACKGNFSFSSILWNTRTHELRLFDARNNESILDIPFQISDSNDIEGIVAGIDTQKVHEDLKKARPNSEWIFLQVVGIRYVIVRLNFPIGLSREEMPEKILGSHSMKHFLYDREGREYTDGMCMFRCLAYHKTKARDLEETTHELYNQWCRFQTNDMQRKSSDMSYGLDYKFLSQFEKCFNINIKMYSMAVDDTVVKRYENFIKYGDEMFVNLHNNHVSYVINKNVYMNKFKCRNCEKLLCDGRAHSRHAETNCGSQTELKFIGRFKTKGDSVFSRMRDLGLKGFRESGSYPYFIVFDCESILKALKDIHDLESLQKDDEKEKPKTQWINEHCPISCSIVTNIPKYQGKTCFVEENPRNLVEKILQFMIDASIEAGKLEEKVYEKSFEELKALLKDAKQDENTKLKDFISNTMGSLYGYCRQVPVVGFNSARYDMNLIMKYLVASVSHLGECHRRKMIEEQVANGTMKEATANFQLENPPDCPEDADKHTIYQIQNVIKKGGAYACVSMPSLKFLDIANYLCPGVSYDAFVLAFDCDLRKSFLPYEWFRSPDLLNYPELPPYEAFYSTLKSHNTLEAEYHTYERLMKELGDESKVLKTMKLKAKPLTGQQNYDNLQKIWRDNNMKIFKDFLIYYNNLDVEPFRQAVENMKKVYDNLGIDFLKTTTSAPGVARELLFKSVKPDVYFSIVDRRDESFFWKMKKSLVGGPSLVMKRHAEVNKTRIRGGSKLCKYIWGGDANALYLWSFMQNMPVGCYSRRLLENMFRLERRDQYLTEVDWLDYLIEQGKKSDPDFHIAHFLNGNQMRIGPYFVDGFRRDGEKKIVYEYNGCKWHGCQMCRQKLNPEDETYEETIKEWDEAYAKTKRRERYIQKKKGCEMVIMWECEFKKELKVNAELKAKTERRKSVLGKEPSMDDIIKSIEDDSLFGLVECDIRVPDDPVMQEYFSEMCPIFKNIEIPPEHWGEYMTKIADKCKLSKKPRTGLIGSMFAEKMVFATPLLQWYLSKGMKIDKIYEVIEYERREKCFIDFANDVTNARRQGDRDPAFAILADVWKLIGNSAFGSTLMDKTKHKNVRLTCAITKALRWVNNAKFRNLSELGEDVYEVEMAKNSIQMDLPLQIGFFILQYAKLRMLSFYYDVIDRFISREDYEYLEMDTDSAYIAFSSTDFESLIPKDKWEDYMKIRDEWFPRKDPAYATIDRRTPGLFKKEYDGDKMICLAAKSYCIENSAKKNVKFSCKGINKRQYDNPMSIYEHCLMEEDVVMGTNRGFRMHQKSIQTYSQKKIGFNCFYVKREVQADGIHTKPLKL